MAKKVAKKEEKVQFVNCLTCKRGELHQWRENPIISFCDYFHNRQVARFLRPCAGYEKQKANKLIIHHEKDGTTTLKQVSA